MAKSGRDVKRRFSKIEKRSTDAYAKNTVCIPYMQCICVGLARTIWCIYMVIKRNFRQGNHQYTVIYGVNIRFWPTLHI